MTSFSPPSFKVFFFLVDFAEMLNNKQISTTLQLNPFLSPVSQCCYF